MGALKLNNINSIGFGNRTSQTTHNPPSPSLPPKQDGHRQLGLALEGLAVMDFRFNIKKPKIGINNRQEGITEKLTPHKEYVLDKNADIRIGKTTINLDHAFRYLENGTYTIGRKKGCCDIALEDETVSRKHLKMTKMGNSYVLEDLGSSNGTKILREIDPNELCRDFNNDGVEISPIYIKNSLDVKRHFWEAIETGKYTESFESYVNTINKAHKLACEGKSGNDLYYLNDKGELVPKERIRPGIIRSDCHRLTNYRHKKALECEEIAKKYNDPFLIENKETYVYLPGISQKNLPSNDLAERNGRLMARHFYPAGTSMQEYYREMYATSKEAVQLIEQKAPANIILSALARHYQYAVNARPYWQINNSLFMNEINTLLEKAEMPPMLHGNLDHAAMRLQPQNFEKYFRDFYYENRIY